jgi:tetratricopeptide (TPR) repeat protein
MHTIDCHAAIEQLLDYWENPDQHRAEADAAISHIKKCPHCESRMGHLIRALTTDEEDSLTCQECQDLLADYLQAEAEGWAHEERWRPVAFHLETCPHCSAAYASLSDLIALAYGERGEEPPRYPVPELSFLRQDRPPQPVSIPRRLDELGRLIIEFFAEFVRALQPPAYQRAYATALATFGIAIVVCLLFTGGFFAYRGYRRQQAAVHYNRSIVYLANESWDLAIYEFDQALAIDPTYEDAAEKRAEAQKQLALKSLMAKADDLCPDADWAACVEKLEQVREPDPDYGRVETKLFEAYRNYGQALMEIDDLSGAVEQFDKALELDPEAAEVRAIRDLVDAYQKGEVAYNNEEWKIAIDALAYVHSTDANFKDTQDLLYMAYVKYGQELVQAGNVEEANDCAQKALHIRPGGSEALACLEEVEYQQYLAHVDKCNKLLDDGKLDEAQAEFEEALDIQPGGAEAQAGLDKVYEARVAKGDELLKEGKLDEAQAEFERALDIKSDGTEAQAGLDEVYDAHVAKGHDLLDGCKCKEAKAEFDKARDIKPDGTEAQDGLDRYVDDCEEPQFSLMANAKNDHSSTQGYNNWYYMCWVDRDKGWEEMPWDIEDKHWQCRWEPGGTREISDQIRFSDDGTGHPGPHEYAALVWQSPISGQIKIAGEARQEDTRGGDGVEVKIVHNSRQLWEVRIPCYDGKGKAFNLEITVQKGDKLYFVIGSGGAGDPTYDKTYFNPSIYLMTYKCRPPE